LIFGIWNIHTYVGNILGSLIAGAVLDHFGNDNWAMAFIIPGIIIIVMAVLTFLFLIPRESIRA
jgi:sugar phosphate permease